MQGVVRPLLLRASSLRQEIRAACAARRRDDIDVLLAEVIRVYTLPQPTTDTTSSAARSSSGPPELNGSSAAPTSSGSLLNGSLSVTAQQQPTATAELIEIVKDVARQRQPAPQFWKFVTTEAARLAEDGKKGQSPGESQGEGDGLLAALQLVYWALQAGSGNALNAELPELYRRLSKQLNTDSSPLSRSPESAMWLLQVSSIIKPAPSTDALRVAVQFLQDHVYIYDAAQCVAVLRHLSSMQWPAVELVQAMMRRLGGMLDDLRPYDMAWCAYALAHLREVSDTFLHALSQAFIAQMHNTRPSDVSRFLTALTRMGGNDEGILERCAERICAWDVSMRESPDDWTTLTSIVEAFSRLNYSHIAFLSHVMPHLTRLAADVDDVNKVMPLWCNVWRLGVWDGPLRGALRRRAMTEVDQLDVPGMARATELCYSYLGFSDLPLFVGLMRSTWGRSEWLERFRASATPQPYYGHNNRERKEREAQAKNISMLGNNTWTALHCLTCLPSCNEGPSNGALWEQASLDDLSRLQTLMADLPTGKKGDDRMSSTFHEEVLKAMPLRLQQATTNEVRASKYLLDLVLPPSATTLIPPDPPHTSAEPDDYGRYDHNEVTLHSDSESFEGDSDGGNTTTSGRQIARVKQLVQLHRAGILSTELSPSCTVSAIVIPDTAVGESSDDGSVWRLARDKLLTAKPPRPFDTIDVHRGHIQRAVVRYVNKVIAVFELRPPNPHRQRQKNNKENKGDQRQPEGQADQSDSEVAGETNTAADTEETTVEAPEPQSEEPSQQSEADAAAAAAEARPPQPKKWTLKVRHDVMCAPEQHMDFLQREMTKKWTRAHNRKGNTSDKGQQQQEHDPPAGSVLSVSVDPLFVRVHVCEGDELYAKCDLLVDEITKPSGGSKKSKKKRGMGESEDDGGSDEDT